MKYGNNLSVIRALVIGGLFIVAGRVAATPYAFSVDQIMLQGNVPGFAVDDFDDGIIAPWAISFPTVVESGGVVTLSNPGKIDISLFDNYLVSEEESVLRLNDNLGVIDGAGEFVVQSKWLPIVPAQDQFFSMCTFLDNPFGVELESINIGIFNIDPLLADLFGVPAGLTIFFEESFEEPDMEIRQLFPVAAEDIRDNILFSLYFDDSNDLFTGEFSLDGGATFQSPFDPIYVDMSEVVFSGWAFNAVSHDIQAVPEPSTLLLMTTGLAGLGFARWKKMKI